MKRSLVLAAAVIGLALVGNAAQAQYRPPPASREEVSSGGDGFDEAVSLKRFRKGNEDWDTQELVASGMKALHQEHVRILKELAEIKAALRELETTQ
jgi:hypothetical protein